MRIDRISISNFKKISDLTLDLGDITYLVGGNNSGKSSVLQAIHMAVSCAQTSFEQQQTVVAESSLRYCPTGEFYRLGNSAPYENRRDGSRAIIEFAGKTTDDADASYRIEIYKARNHHNVGVDRSGVALGFGQVICDPATLFTVYVPGLAGIPHSEEMQSYPSVFLRAAGGEANLVFRNILRLTALKGGLEELEKLLFSVIGPCKFKLLFDERRDLYVDVRVSFRPPFEDASFVPIDLAGTGILQVTQIVAYVVLFGPKLLLIDEPDSHLHPSRQGLLSAAFQEIVERYKCKILVSTHSRHLVSSAPKDTHLVWLREGRIETQDEENALIPILMDLGALDQLDSNGAEIIICTEDKGKKLLESCVRQLNLQDRIRVISYNGVTNAASAVAINAMADLFPNRPRIIVHRDRDFLTEDELQRWGLDYTNRNMHVFSPRLPDIESYYVTPEHIAQVYGRPEADAEAALHRVFDAIGPELRGIFRSKRQEANRKFWADGGGPATDDLWPPAQAVTDEFALGKRVMSRLNDDVPATFGRRENLAGAPSLALSQELLGFLGVIGVPELE